MIYTNSVAQACYDAAAEHYAKSNAHSVLNAYYERPATLSLLPNVNNKDVLDAGCGPGNLAEKLLDQGAKLTCVDVSEKMIEVVKRRLGDRVQAFQANLADPLTSFRDKSFDIVVSSLTMHYIENWYPVFEEYFRILRSGGVMVFSTHHPIGDYRVSPSKRYHDIELIEEIWTISGEQFQMRFFRRSFSQIIMPPIKAGFLIDTIAEPLPSPETKKTHPDWYTKLMLRPEFLFLRIQKV